MTLSVEQKKDLTQKLTSLQETFPETYYTVADLLLFSAFSKEPIAYTDNQRQLLFSALLEQDNMKKYAGASSRDKSSIKQKILERSEHLQEEYRRKGSVSFQPILEPLEKRLSLFADVAGLFAKDFTLQVLLFLFGKLHDWIPERYHKKLTSMVDYSLTRTALLLLPHGVLKTFFSDYEPIEKCIDFLVYQQTPDQLVKQISHQKILTRIVEAIADNPAGETKKVIQSIFDQKNKVADKQALFEKFNSIEDEDRLQMINVGVLILKDLFDKEEASVQFKKTATSLNTFYNALIAYRAGTISCLALTGTMGSALMVLKDLYDWYNAPKEIEKDAAYADMQFMVRELCEHFDRAFNSLSAGQQKILHALQDLKTGQQEIKQRLVEIKNSMKQYADQAMEALCAIERMKLKVYRDNVLTKKPMPKVDVILSELTNIYQYATIGAPTLPYFTGSADSMVISDDKLHIEIAQKNRMHCSFHLFYRLIKVLNIPTTVVIPVMPNPLEFVNACRVYCDILSAQGTLFGNPAASEQIKHELESMFQFGRNITTFIHDTSDRGNIIDHVIPVYLQRGKALGKRLELLVKQKFDAMMKPHREFFSGTRTHQFSKYPKETQAMYAAWEKFRSDLMHHTESIIKKGELEGELNEFLQASTALLFCLQLNLLRQGQGDITDMPFEWERGVFDTQAVFKQIVCGAFGQFRYEPAPTGNNHVDIEKLHEYVNQNFMRHVHFTVKHVRTHIVSLKPMHSLSELVLALSTIALYAPTETPDVDAKEDLIFETIVNSCDPARGDSIYSHCRFSQDNQYLITFGLLDVTPSAFEWGLRASFILPTVYRTSNWESASVWAHYGQDNVGSCALSFDHSKIIAGRYSDQLHGYTYEYEFKGLEYLGVPYQEPLREAPISKFLAYSPQGNYEVFIGWEGGGCSISKITGGKKQVASKSCNFAMATFSLGEEYVAACGSVWVGPNDYRGRSEPIVFIWQSADWTLAPQEFHEKAQGSYTYCAFSPNLQWFAVTGQYCQIWSVSDWSMLHKSDLSNGQCAFSKDNLFLMTTHNETIADKEEAAIQISSTSTWDILRRIPWQGRIQDLNVSPDGEKIVMCGRNEHKKGRLSVWRANAFFSSTDTASHSEQGSDATVLEVVAQDAPSCANQCM